MGSHVWGFLCLSDTTSTSQINYQNHLMHFIMYMMMISFLGIYKYVCVYNIWYIFGWSVLIYCHPRFFLFKYIQSYAYVFHIYNIYIQYIHTQECFSDIYIYIYLFMCVFEFHMIYKALSLYTVAYSRCKKRTGREQWSSPR